MAVKITDICICCGSCIDECPVEAIVDDSNNPQGADAYFVDAKKCVECVGHNDEPACASACPTDGCIVWDVVSDGQAYRQDIGSELRDGQNPVAG
ncbi:MAG: ferredoxin [Campylobacter sp.]|nr:ferredoxin [Campylobacter sp.]